MNKNRNILANKGSIRFRKWSRKSYAVFIAIKKSVSIGTLAKNIVDRLLLKTNKLEVIVPHGSRLSLQQKSMNEVLSHEEIILSIFPTVTIA